MKKALLTSLLLIACGSSQKTGPVAGGGAPPPPPEGGIATGPAKPEVAHSKEEKNDFKAAADYFNTQDKGTWSEAACRQSASNFQAVVRNHPNVVQAQYMVGLSFHKCGMYKDAEDAYQAALHINPQHGESKSNLGEIYFRANKIPDARRYWEAAVKDNGKLIAARNNIASMELEDMRKLPGCHCDKDPAWKKLDEDARFNLSNVLGVDSDNVKAYTLFGLIYLEGYEKNKNRLDLAKTLLDEAKKRNEKYADLQNAYGLYYLRRNSLNEALQHFMAAVDANPKFVEARLNVGTTTLGFRKYDTAKEQFQQAIALDPKRYDAYIGLGIAMRGLKDLDGAEQQYQKARQTDDRRGDAYYNLGVLYKDFRANKAGDLKASQDVYRKAKEFFRQFLDKPASDADKAEAKEQVTLCDKNIAQIDQFLAAQAAAPPPPAPTPAPAAPPAGATPPATPPSK